MRCPGLHQLCTRKEFLQASVLWFPSLSVGLKTDGNFPVFSRSVFYILPLRFRIFRKSGIRTKSGMEVVGIQTEVETTFFRLYFWNPGFHRNCSVFNPECLPNLKRPTKGGPRREGTHLKNPSPSKSQPTQSPIAPHALALDSASAASTRDSKSRRHCSSHVFLAARIGYMQEQKVLFF
jgi:hypothetical protein